MIHLLFFTFLGFLFIGSSSSCTGKPNIILILVDDLGYGDLACYGSKANHTPYIDRLASEGMRLTDFHSNGAMCSPTRAALLTGRYQYRYGQIFEYALSGVNHADQGLPHDAWTIAEMLKESGYATGMYGKWHLGYKTPFLPPDQGFDDFRGLVSGDGDHHTHIDRQGREDWWYNNEPEMESGYSTDLITNHSIRFIEEHQDEPFFLYISHLAIHFPWQGPDDPPHREEGFNYRDDKWGIIHNHNDVRPHVKSMLSSIDEGCGKILSKLENLDLVNQTLIIFTSDNGGYISYGSLFHQISSNGPLRGQKQQVYEGGHRVPFIARWPGKIEAGSISGELTMTMDLFPTLAYLAGAEINDQALDGMDISTLLIENKTLPDRALFWKIGEHSKAVRKGPWKICVTGNAAPELYNLEEDIGEKINLAGKNPDLVDTLMSAYKSWEMEVTANYE